MSEENIIVKETSEKSYDLTAVLAFLLGQLGVHRFYTGYIGIGIAQLFTFGGLGIWWLVDVISICLNEYKDAQGLPLKKYNKVLAYVLLGLLIFGLVSALWSLFILLIIVIIASQIKTL